jgi:hypothetical protein
MTRSFSLARVLTPLALAGAIAIPAAAQSESPSPKLHARLLERLSNEPGPAKAWVFFTDKGLAREADLAAALDQVERTYNPRALQRRALRGENAARGDRLVDIHDIPVCESYINDVLAAGVKLDNNIRWLNAITVYGTRSQLDEIAKLPFVDRLEPVQRSLRKSQPLNVQEQAAGKIETGGADRSINYGLSQAQLQQINLIALHDAGYTGQGVIVGILDTGFRRDHNAFTNPAKPVQVIAEYDFVANDNNTAPQAGDPSSQHDHGTMILGCIGSYLPGTVVGGAFDAHFVLAKTEDTTQEVPAEEDDYVAGLQFTEANGADMTTASLGYIDWYTQAQMNGVTAVTSIAMNIHTANGVHHTNAAGNEGNDTNPATSHLVAPSDAFKCITLGAVSSSGAIAYFSSDGPTADGRVKPELLARGVTTYTVSPSSTTATTSADGTSLSTPLAACAVACLVQARPWWTVDQMRAHLFATADYAATHGGAFDPLYVRGYGIINAYAAYNTCDHAGVITLDQPKYPCGDVATIAVSDCGLDQNHGAIETVQVTIASTSEPAGETVTLTELGPDAAYFEGTIALSLTDAAGVLWIAAGDTITATYVDADNGQGGQNIVVTDTAAVDCTAPVISNVQAVNVLARSATIQFAANEPVKAKVFYGPACDQLIGMAESTSFSANPAVNLSGLTDNSAYFYTVQATDEAGNVASDNNGGACYSFYTPDVPEYYTELFTANNDLDNRAFEFYPGDVIPYFGCTYPITALPTDPNGGTSLGFTSDDEFKTITIPGGNQVFLYDVAYSTLYVGANGYITFGTGDTDYTETIADHFDTPRISALFDDLSPQNSAAQASYKILSDRVVVTFRNVPEYLTSNSNTFQFELYYYGLIRISYLGIAAADGLAGLSRGTGTPADFYMSDLTTIGSCGPRPPSAVSQAVQTPVGQPVPITLQGEDDGLPDPPAALTYIITSLPQRALRDAGDNHLITSGELPYTLLGSAVTYSPGNVFQGVDAFQFKVNDGGTPPEGGDSEIATVTITVGGPQLVYSFPFDTNPGWTTEDQWAFGVPTGAVAGSGRDPNSGHTGTNVYGYNLNGAYPNSMPERHLTSTPIDCTNLSQVRVKFWRWLGVERKTYDHAYFRVSNNGTTWTTIWENPDTSMNDTTWAQFEYDISAVADHQPALRLRWTMGTTDSSVTYQGWNIDDVEIWGIVPITPQGCPGDADCDGDVDFFDIDAFVARLGCPGSGPACDEGCPWQNADVDADGDVDFFDIDPFVGQLGTTCP